MKICSKAHQIELLKKFLVGRGMLRSLFNQRMAMRHATQTDRQNIAPPPPPPPLANPAYAYLFKKQLKLELFLYKTRRYRIWSDMCIYLLRYLNKYQVTPVTLQT